MTGTLTFGDRSLSSPRTVVPGRLRATRHPHVLELNARVWLAEQPSASSLADIPDTALERIAAQGFDLLWLMGVWKTGILSSEVARAHEGMRRDYDAALPGWRPEDVIGSPFAIQSYQVSDELGGNEALATLRRRLAQRGIGLLLDFVPNHTAIDHPCVARHPEFYMQCEAEEAAARPHDFVRVDTELGERWIAHGRDPYFPPWTDTAQLNIHHAGVRSEQKATLARIAELCDGVRCDMAMLCIDEVFERTWGDRARRHLDGDAATGEYWNEMVGAIRAKHPAFLFIAEVYWQLEPRILELGFDYAYDKVLYDRLRFDAASAVNKHLAEDDQQRRMVRFIENHDEDRAAVAFEGARHRAAATLCYTLPGLRLFHQGQLEGRRVRQPVQLERRPEESPDTELTTFYATLLDGIIDPVFRIGSFRRLDLEDAWEGNASRSDIVAHLWDASHLGRRLVVINLSDRQAQARVRLAATAAPSDRLRLRDLIGPECYVRYRAELDDDGLFLDLEPYQAHIFAIEACS